MPPLAPTSTRHRSESPHSPLATTKSISASPGIEGRDRFHAGLRATALSRLDQWIQRCKIQRHFAADDHTSKGESVAGRVMVVLPVELKLGVIRDLGCTVDVIETDPIQRERDERRRRS